MTGKGDRLGTSVLGPGFVHVIRNDNGKDYG